jgi:hypothetical protein
MSELRLDTWRLPAAEVGAENPLPPLDRPRYQPFLSGKAEDDPEAGYVPDYLPYPVQDGYTRQRQPRDLKVAVLENEMLRATFLLEYGGRMWSIVHKPSGRELLYVNPMFQPANLAMRNAWFSGGVEWNMGVIAHTPFTCAPLFAARAHMPDGTPILRMYEWERIRRAAYQIDIYLPDGAQFLYVRVKLVNPFDHNVPMYWWSNIAVPEAEDVRVIVPAAESYQYALSVENLKTVAVPYVDGTDISYTTNSTVAADYFFLIPPGQRPWVTALDKDGKGLIQASTSALRGRKLFLWGTGQGGTRWQEWLSGTGKYLEIQAGLAPTQLEYATLPARSTLTWLEAYGLMEADPGVVHGKDWAAARADVDTRLNAMLPRAVFEAEYARGAAWEDQPPDEILHRGSGWGALEALRREQAKETPFASTALDFGGTLGAAQQPWVNLLNSGRFPETDGDTLTAGILVQPEWRALLEKSVAQDGGGWEAWLHLGVMRLHDGDLSGARQAWETSLARRRTAWALRNLAVLARREGSTDKAADLYREAQKLRPDLLPLLIETGRALINAGAPGEFLALLDTQPPAVRENGRIHLLEVEAGLAVGDLDRVGRLFGDGFEIVDYQEGDEILTALWFRYHAERISRDEGVPNDDALRARVQHEHPLPAHFDFRMKNS